MRITGLIAILAVALTAGTATIAGAASRDAATTAARQFEGTVVSVNREARSFRLRDSERGTVRIKVTRSTRFERISGFSGLKAGAKNIEATVRRSDGRWVAIEVERSGGGGDHGGDDDAGDDHGGDDHGGGGHGDDDGGGHGGHGGGGGDDS